MTREEILALVQRRRTAYNTRDAAALAGTHAETGVVISPFGGVQEGRAEIERVYRLWFTAFTDMSFSNDDSDVVIDGDRVVLIGRLAGTHAGDFFGLSPTGRRIEVQAAQVMKVADGFVVEERRIYDFTGVLIQVGVLRAKPVA